MSLKSYMKFVLLLMCVLALSNIIFGGQSQPTPTPTATPTPTPTPTPTATPDCDDCESEEAVDIYCEGCYLPDPYNPLDPCIEEPCSFYPACDAVLRTWCENSSGGYYEICCDEYEVYFDIIGNCTFVPPGPHDPYCECKFVYAPVPYPNTINMCVE